MQALSKAIVAANTGNWSEVVERLQAMPLGAEDRAARQQVLDLALQVLLAGDFEHQWQVAKIFPKLGDLAIAPLLALLNDTEVEIEERWFVARILGSFKRPEAIVALVETIRQGEDAELSALAISALAQIGVAAIPALTALLPTADCALAVTALSQIQHSQTIDPLLSTIDHPDPQVRTATISALGCFHDPRILPHLITKLTDLAPNVRRAAVVAICLRSELAIELDLVRHLQPLLFDLNLAVCEATAIGLARLPDPRVVGILSEVLAASRTPASLCTQIVLALGWIGTRPAMDSLATALVTASPEASIEIVRSISSTEGGRDYATQLLSAYLRSNIATLAAVVKQEIAVALGNLGNLSSVPELIQLLADPDDRVKLYTIASIAKLSPALPTQILELADRSDLTPDLQVGVTMCLAHWQARSPQC